jgi:hypothetical protein
MHRTFRRLAASASFLASVAFSVSGFDGHQGAGEMVMMRRGDVDGVDGRIGDQLPGAGASLRNRPLVGESLRAGRGAGADGDDVLPGVLLQRPDEAFGDPARPQDAPAQGRHRERVLAAGWWQGRRKDHGRLLGLFPAVTAWWA